MADHIVTKDNKELVYSLAYDGITKKRIAEYINVSLPTLDRHYKLNFIRGNVDAERDMQRNLTQRAVEDKNVTAAIVRAKFLGAVEAKHSEEQEEKPQIVEHRIVQIDKDNYKDIPSGIILEGEAEEIPTDTSDS